MRPDVAKMYDPIYRRWWLSVALSVLLMTGCANAPPRSSVDQGKGKAQPRISSPGKPSKNRLSVEKQLRDLVRQWEGTPYRMGGATRRGTDCSGFVQRLYQDVFERQIPRSTVLQIKSGRPVIKRQLRTGDLVFFKIPRKGRHVGIYLGRMEFAHASTRRGVTISSLENRYWRQNYWTARRYLDASHN